MTVLQVSNYNFLTPSASGGVVYNAAEGTFTTVDNAIYTAIRAKKIPEIGSEFLATLIEAGILHDGSQHERIRRRFDLRRFAGTHVNVTLAPTIECNLACWYCYQNERRYLGVMDEATQDATLEFIAAVTAGKESFNIDWFGGEPLLSVEVIELMISRIRDRIADGGPQYVGGSIITNGLLLNDANVAILERVGIQNVQVSVDRLLHVPPTKRGLLSDTGTPSPILTNVLKYRKRLNFAIRINLAELPQNELDVIEATLKKFGVQHIARLARVEDNIAECSAPGRGVVAGGMLTRKAFAKAKIGFAKGTQAYLDAMQAELTPKQGFCGATDGSLFVVDYRGDVSRCFISAGVADERIGNVRELANAGSEGFLSHGGSRPSVAGI